MPRAASQPCRSQGSPFSPPRLPTTQVTPQEGLHGAVPLWWPLLAGDTGTRRVCCRRFKTKCLWGNWHGQGPTAGLCWWGEAMTCWAPAPRGQEAPGCWAGWRCLPSVHSLYLSIKPFHPSSVHGVGWGAATHSHGRSLCLSCICFHVRMGTGWSGRAPGAPALLPSGTLTPSHQPQLFACLDPSSALLASSHYHPGCLLVWGHCMPFLVLPLRRFQPVSALGPGRTVHGGGRSQGHLCGHCCLSW